MPLLRLSLRPPILKALERLNTSACCEQDTQSVENYLTDLVETEVVRRYEETYDRKLSEDFGVDREGEDAAHG